MSRAPRTCAHASHAILWSLTIAAESARTAVPSTVCEYDDPNELRRGRPFDGPSACAYRASRPVHSRIAIWLVECRSAVDIGCGIFAIDHRVSPSPWVDEY